MELEPPRFESHPRLERARLRRLDAEALSAMGDNEASRERCQSTLSTAGLWVPRSGAAQLVNALAQGLRLAVRRLLPSGLGHAPRQDLPLLKEAALATGVLSRYFLDKGDPLGMLYAILQGADVSLRAEAPEPLAQSAGMLGAMVGLMGLRGAAEHYFRLAREAAQRSGNELARIRLATTEGSYAFLRGELGAALGVMEPALARSQEIGAAYETEFLLQLVATVSLLRGDFETSLRHAVQSLQSAHELGHAQHYRWGLQIQATCELELGHHERALARALECERAFREAGALTDQLSSLGVIASARLRLGDLEGALRTAEEARVLSGDFRVTALNVFAFHRYVPEVYLTAWARAANRGEPAAHHARCVALGERAFHRYSRSYPCGEPHALRLAALHTALRDNPRKARELMARASRRSSELGIHLSGESLPLL
jgi:tetratricopeptide (TPR) repeat protein